MRIVCSSIDTQIAGVSYNARKIKSRIREAIDAKADVIVFPELALTGYSCGDLFFNKSLLQETLVNLDSIREFSVGLDILIALGLPLLLEDRLYDCAVCIFNGTILGVVPKMLLQNGCDYDEGRWFSEPKNDGVKFVELLGHTAPFGHWILFKDETCGVKIGVEIGSELFAPISPSSALALMGAHVILNPAALHETVTSPEETQAQAQGASLAQKSVYVYCSGGFESTTDAVFSSYKCAYCNGKALGESNVDCADGELTVDVVPSNLLGARIRKGRCAPIPLPSPLVVPFQKRKHCQASGAYYGVREPFLEGLPVETVCRRVLDLQTKALLQKMRYTNKTKLIIGVSGGMDSTAALLACRECCKRNGLSVENIIGVTMPGPGTTDRTLRNARRLMDTLGVTSMTVNIHEATESLLADIGQPEGLFNVTYEQTQSRQRTRILMDLANKTDGLVIGTGDMSEFALGWMSYSGDHISMYAINCGIPKTVIRHMVGWFCDAAEGALKEILLDIMKTPISPELLPVNHDGRQTQSTEKLVGPYIVHDFFLYHFLVNGCETAKIYKLACDAFSGVYEAREIRDWLKLFIRRFFTRQFKRSCFSDGAQYFSVGLSPRSAWRMPSDVSCSEWLAEIERIP